MHDVNVDGAAAIAQACRDASVARLVHVSSLCAHASAPSEYSRTKARGARVAPLTR